MNMNMGNMSGLSTCSVTGDAKPMQFPLAQRRKRRVLFTQAQVKHARRSKSEAQVVKILHPPPGMLAHVPLPTKEKGSFEAVSTALPT